MPNYITIPTIKKRFEQPLLLILSDIPNTTICVTRSRSFLHIEAQTNDNIAHQRAVKLYVSNALPTLSQCLLSPRPLEREGAER